MVVKQLKANFIKYDTYYDNKIHLQLCYSRELYRLLKFKKLVDNTKFINDLATGKAKLLLGYLRDNRFYRKFLEDIKEKYPKLNIKDIQKNIFILEASNTKIYYICLNDINIISFKDIIEKNMKFDAAILNPPYDGSLHLEILSEVKKHVVGTICNISPIRWLLDPLGPYKKNSDYNKFEYLISKYIKELTIIKAADAHKLFNAEMPFDLAIYVLDNSGGFNYINFTHNFVVDRFLEKQKFIVLDENLKDGIRVKIPKIVTGGCGHDIKTKRNLGKLLWFNNGLKDNKPWYNFYQKNQNTKLTDTIPLSIKFNTIVEAENFINSFNTIFAQYFNSKILTNASISYKQYLWVENYLLPWTNKRFCEYFNITGYISDTEAEPGSEWEIILNEMKE